MEWNDANNFMHLEHALHKIFNQIPMVVAQRLILSLMRRFAGAYGI